MVAIRLCQQVLEGQWEATTEQGVSLAGPDVPSAAQQLAVSGLAVLTSVTLTEQPPSLDFSTT